MMNDKQLHKLCGKQGRLAKIRLQQTITIDKHLPTLALANEVNDLDGFKETLRTHSMPILENDLLEDMCSDSSQYQQWLGSLEFDIMTRIGLAPALDAILEIKTVRVLELYVPAVVSYDGSSIKDVERLLATPGLSPLVCGEAALWFALEKPHDWAALEKRHNYVKMVELVQGWIERSQPGISQSYFSTFITYNSELDDYPGEKIAAVVTASMKKVRTLRTLRVAEREKRGREKREGLCVYCLELEATTALAPCGHRCLCQEHAELLLGMGEGCPLCRAPIQSLLRVYM